MFVEPEGGGQDGTVAPIQAQERLIGRPLDVVQWFYPWGSTFPSWRENWAIAGGRRNLITWGRSSAQSMADGHDDAVIDARAKGLAALRAPVLLRWAGEMDSASVSGTSGSPKVFIAAWRRLHDRFRAAGASNVSLVWCPTSDGFATGKAQQYYPGDAYVDWICADGYTWAPKKPGAKWDSFETVFSSFYAWASTKGKPLLVGETGALEDPSRPGRKAEWIRSMADTLEHRMPAIKSVVWFDATHAPRFSPGNEYDFRLATSTSAADAWAEISRRAYLHP